MQDLTCPSTGTLRAHVDNPDPDIEAHLDDCASCREMMVTVVSNVGVVDNALAMLDSVNVSSTDTTPNSETIGDAVVSIDSARSAKRAWFSGRTVRPLSYAAGIALVAVLAITPMGQQAVAQILDSFRSEELQVVDVSELSNDPEAFMMFELEQLGDVDYNYGEELFPWDYSPTAAEIEESTGIAPVDGAVLAATFDGDSEIEYLVETSGGDVAITFRSTAANGVPEHLDGTKLNITVPTVVVTVAGTPSGSESVAALRATPIEVTTEGAPLSEVRDHLLSREDIPESLRAQLEGIESWERTLPLPVDVSENVVRDVQINGREGYAFGDNTGLAAGVLWLDGEYINGLSGTLPIDDLITVAESL